MTRCVILDSPGLEPLATAAASWTPPCCYVPRGAVPELPDPVG